MEDWNGKIRLMVKQTEFDIDHAVKEHDGIDRDMIGILYDRIVVKKAVSCHETFRPAATAPAPVDWSKASWVLAGIHVCFVEMTSGFNPQRDVIEAMPDKAARTKALAAHREKLLLHSGRRRQTVIIRAAHRTCAQRQEGNADARLLGTISRIGEAAQRGGISAMARARIAASPA